MADKTESEPIKVGIIPDFFHDIIAYIIPGYTVIILLLSNFYIIGIFPQLFNINLDIKGYSLSLLIAYVVGRFFEQFGLMTIHHRKILLIKKLENKKLPSIKFAVKTLSPKWSLLFEPENKSYTESFKKNVIAKIQSWLDLQEGTPLMKECKDKHKDDYFNLIQFYLRERFPAVALYEKKQNATIVLTRSLSIIFAANIFFYNMSLYIHFSWHETSLNATAIIWIVTNMLFSWIFYKRFQQDKIYHAMYIFETFISTKKFLTSKKEE